MILNTAQMQGSIPCTGNIKRVTEAPDLFH